MEMWWMGKTFVEMAGVVWYTRESLFLLATHPNISDSL